MKLKNVAGKYLSVVYHYNTGNERKADHRGGDGGEQAQRSHVFQLFSSVGHLNVG